VTREPPADRWPSIAARRPQADAATVDAEQQVQARGRLRAGGTPPARSQGGRRARAPARRPAGPPGARPHAERVPLPLLFFSSAARPLAPPLALQALARARRSPPPSLPPASLSRRPSSGASRSCRSSMRRRRRTSSAPRPPPRSSATCAAAAAAAAPRNSGRAPRLARPCRPAAWLCSDRRALALGTPPSPPPRSPADARHPPPPPSHPFPPPPPPPPRHRSCASRARRPPACRWRWRRRRRASAFSPPSCRRPTPRSASSWPSWTCASGS